LFPADGPYHRPDGRIDVTVVYLELDRARAPKPPVFPATARLEAVTRVPLSYYRYLYDAVGRPWQWVDRKRLDDETLAAIVHHPDVAITVLHNGGAPAGFVEIDHRLAPASSNIAYFGLTPDFTERGLGPPFLAASIGLAQARNARRVLVNTCNLDHPAALPLYLKSGFEPLEIRKVVFDPRL
jgi:GNAT superfamily N-acetyltransferase